MLDMGRNMSTDLFFCCNFYRSGGNLRDKGGKK